MSSGADRLVRMANQIARNLEAQGREAAIMQTAAHIKKFWDPRMRAGLKAYIDEGGDELSDIALAAFQSLETG